MSFFADAAERRATHSASRSPMGRSRPSASGTAAAVWSSFLFGTHDHEAAVFRGGMGQPLGAEDRGRHGCGNSIDSYRCVGMGVVLVDEAGLDRHTHHLRADVVADGGDRFRESYSPEASLGRADGRSDRVSHLRSRRRSGEPCLVRHPGFVSRSRSPSCSGAVSRFPW